MSKVKNVLRYLISRYPYESDLSKTRVTKMVYLADWYSVIKHNRQITNIDWVFDHYGPYVPDVFRTAEKDRKLKIKSSYSMYGTPKSLITLKNNDSDINYKLTNQEKEIIDAVIKETKDLSWNSFINKIYDTEPIRQGKRYGRLNLARYAKLNL